MIPAVHDDEFVLRLYFSTNGFLRRAVGVLTDGFCDEWFSFDKDSVGEDTDCAAAFSVINCICGQTGTTTIF